MSKISLTSHFFLLFIIIWGISCFNLLNKHFINAFCRKFIWKIFWILIDCQSCNETKNFIFSILLKNLKILSFRFIGSSFLATFLVNCKILSLTIWNFFQLRSTWFEKIFHDTFMAFSVNYYMFFFYWEIFNVFLFNDLFTNTINRKI